MKGVASVPGQQNCIEKLWLDDLPLDVCSRIARFLTIPSNNRFNCGYNPSFTFLESQKFDEFLPPLNPVSMIRWKKWPLDKSLGRDFLTEMVVRHGLGGIAALGLLAQRDDPQIYIKSPAQRLSAFQRFYDLQAGVHASHLSSVTLRLWSPDCLKSFLEGLSVLNLRELKIVTKRTTCLHKEFSEDCTLLSNWFPRVESLDLYCMTCSYRQSEINEPRSFLLLAMEHFTALKEVVIRECVPNDEIEKVLQIDRVHLGAGAMLQLGAGAMFQLLEKVSERVVSVDTRRIDNRVANHAANQAIGGSHLETLTRCKGLEEFRGGISCHSEYLIVDTVSKLSNLRVLDIFFCTDPFFRSEGMFLELAKAAPCLTQIYIHNVHIMYSEVQDMLIVLGKRLEAYLDSRCPPGRDREPDENIWREWEPRASSPENELFEYIETLRTASRHNPSFRFFALDIQVRWCRNKEAVAALIPKLETALRILEWRAPLLQTWFLRDFLQRLRLDYDPHHNNSDHEDHMGTVS